MRLLEIISQVALNRFLPLKESFICLLTGCVKPARESMRGNRNKAHAFIIWAVRNLTGIFAWAKVFRIALISQIKSRVLTDDAHRISNDDFIRESGEGAVMPEESPDGAPLIP